MQGEQPGIPIGGWRDKDASRIARPYAIGAPEMKEILSESASAFSSTALARFSQLASLTITSTRSCRARLRTISAYTHGIGSNFPGQSPRNMWPSKPGGLVRFPLGGHAVALGGVESRREIAGS